MGNVSRKEEILRRRRRKKEMIGVKNNEIKNSLIDLLVESTQMRGKNL